MINPATKIKLMVTDDHRLFRTGVANALGKYSDIEVIGEAENGKELLDKLEYLSPDVMTLGIQMPVMDGLTALPIIRKRFPAIKVVILSFLNDPSVITKMMETGAHSYVTKESGVDDIYKAVVNCYDQDFYINKTVRDALLRHYYKNNDKPRSANELKILSLLAEHKSGNEIAEATGLSLRTVKVIIEKMMNDARANSVEALIAHARKEKLIN